MGIPVESIKVGLREEGLGYGLPMCFIELGYTDERLEVEDILREVLEKTTKKGWACIRGDPDPLACGIGTLVRGLSQLQRYVEVETDGLHRDPSWTHAVDRWVANYQDTPVFNYGALRASDTIRIVVPESSGEEDFPYYKKYLEVCSKVNCVKYLVLPKGFPEVVYGRFLELAGRFERVRVY